MKDRFLDGFIVGGLVMLLEDAIIHAEMMQSNPRKPDLVMNRTEILVGSFCGKRKHGILYQALDLLKQQPTVGEFTKEIQEFFSTCTEWFDNLSIPKKADLYGYKGETAIKVALNHIQSLLNNYQNVDSFRKGYLEINKRNIDLCDRLDRAAAREKDLLEALEKSKEIFSKKLRLIRASETKAKDNFAFIESRYWSGVHNNIFELRQEIERMLDKLKLNEFCILMAFMTEENREAAIAKSKKEGGE